MSVLTDNSTITGDGVSTGLATITVADIAALQAYNGLGTAVQVADPLRGGTFYYYSGNSFTGSITYQGARLVGPTGTDFASLGFASGQVITVQGTANNNGSFVIDTVSGNVITTITNLTKQASVSATISIFPYTNEFTFNENTITDPLKGFIKKGFYKNQVIHITGTCRYNGSYTISDDVTEDTITFLPALLTGTGKETANATIADSHTAYTALFTLNSNDTAPTTIVGPTGGFSDNGFRIGQTIQLTGTDSDGLYRIANIVDGSKIIIESEFTPTAETVTSTVTVADGGTSFTASGKGSGYWQRLYDPKDGLSVAWFGAIGNAFYKYAYDGLWYTSGSHETKAHDDTEAIQATIRAAMVDKHRTRKVVLPPGQFLHGTIYLPTGLLLTGSSTPIGAPAFSSSKLTMKRYGGDSIRLTDSGVKHTVTTTLFANAGVTNLDFYGEPANLTGWAISMRDNANTPLKVQDMHFFENLFIRGYPQGGIEIPKGGAPINCQHIKATTLNGPAIFCKSGLASASFDNISTDHNTGGAIWLDGLNSSSNVIITNLKSEQGTNTDFPAKPNSQVNAVICTDCVGAPIIVDNASHHNTTADFGEIKGNPTITWGISNIALNAHGLSVGNKVKFWSTSMLPTNIAAGKTYVVSSVTPNTFEITDPVTNNALIPDPNIAQTKVYDTVILYSNFTDDGRLKAGDLISIETLLRALPVIANLEGITTVTLSGINLNNGDQVKFYTTGALPANIIAGQVYFVVNRTPDTFQISSVKGGVPLVAVVANQSGVHSVYKKTITTNIPRVTWRGTGMDDIGIESAPTPQVISLSGIPYNITEGKFNIVEQTLNSKVVSLGVGTLQTAANLTIGGDDVSAASWGTNGVNLRVNPAVYTDTTAHTGPVNTVAVNSILGGDTLKASSVSTYSQAATLYIGPEPTAGEKVTITSPAPGKYNSFSLITEGVCLFKDFVGVGPTLTSARPTAVLQVQGSFSASAWGSNGIQLRVVGGTLTDDTTPANTSVATSYANVISGANLAAHNNNVTILEAVTLYVASPIASTNTTITSAWALKVGGNLKVIGTLNLQGNLNLPVWRTNGVQLKVSPAILTDTSTPSGGIVANSYANVISGANLAAVNNITITEGVTLYVAPPVASTNTVITSAWALKLGGGLKMQGTFNSPAWGTNGIQLNVSPATLTDTTSTGTIASSYANVINGATLASTASAAITVTEAVSLYIAPPIASSSAQITSAWALKLDGALKLATGTTSFAPVRFNAGPDKATWETGDMGFGSGRFVLVPSGSTPKRIVLSNDAAPLNGQIPIGNGTDYTNATLMQGNGIAISNASGSVTIATDTTVVRASNPAVTDIADGNYRIYKNSGTGEVKLWVNDAGTLKSVTLS